MTTFPPPGPAPLLTTPAVPTGLTLARKAVTDHNALAAAVQDPAVQPVTLHGAADGQAFTVTGPGGTERFTLRGQVACGRGGELHLNQADHRAQLTMTVQILPATLPVEHVNLMGVPERMAERGFAVHAGRWLRWKYATWMRPLHAVHPDGRVVWLAEYDCDEGRGLHWSVCAGERRVAAMVGNAGEEDHTFACAPDDIKAEWIEAGYRPPVFTTHVWRLTPGAADALCAGLAPPAADLVPEAFWTQPGTLDAAADAEVNAALAPYRTLSAPPAPHHHDRMTPRPPGDHACSTS